LIDEEFRLTCLNGLNGIGDDFVGEDDDVNKLDMRIWYNLRNDSEMVRD
jgi:hypothetical protein